MSSRTARLAAPLILAALMLLAFSQARGKGIDPIIDAGRDLYIAGRILAGQTLYLDLVYYYPPAGPYLLALYASLAGSSLFAFELFGLAIALGTLFALYAIARRVAGNLAAFVCGLLFVTLNFTGASTWGANYLFPYSQGTTIGMMFSLIFLWAMLRYTDTPRSEGNASRPAMLFALAILCGCIAAMSKLEYALSVFVTFAAFVLLRGVPVRHLIAAAAAAVFLLAGTSWVFGGSPIAFGWIGERLLTGSLLEAESTKRFYAAVSGVSEWKRNLGLAAAGAAGTILVAALLAAVERRRYRSAADPLLILLLAALSVAIWALSHGHFFRGWFLLQIALCVFLLARERRSPLLLLAIFSIASTVRIALNMTPDWYGFALMLPVYLVIVCTLFGLLPSLRIYSERTVLLWLPLFFILGAEGLLEQRERYAMKRFPVETPRGRFFDANPDRARALTELLQYIEKRRPRTLVVMPEGVSINYFSGVPSPLSRYAFIPPETSAPSVEQETIEQLKRTPPELIVIVSRDMSEFGSQGFGVDYNKALHRHVTDSYVVERGWVLERFQMLAMGRGGASSQ